MDSGAQIFSATGCSSFFAGGGIYKPTPPVGRAKLRDRRKIAAIGMGSVSPFGLLRPGHADCQAADDSTAWWFSSMGWSVVDRKQETIGIGPTLISRMKKRN
jgi:hypothetical protein